MPRYDCRTCIGNSPCCWENPATYDKVREGEIRVGYNGEPTVCPPEVLRRWKFRWWPLNIKISIGWSSLASRHKGMYP